MENSIDENIIILEQLIIANENCIKNAKNKDNPFVDIWKKQNKAIDHILLEYKRVLKENEELRAKWDKDTHILQNELDYANADRIDLAQQNKELRKENEELQKSEQQIYDDYQDIGKIAFEYSDEIEQQNKIIDLMAEYIESKKVLVDKYCYVLTKETIKQYFENKSKEVK